MSTPSTRSWAADAKTGPAGRCAARRTSLPGAAVTVTTDQEAGSEARPWRHWPILAFLPITLLDLILFVLPMIVMGVASVLMIREFHISLHLTADNYLFFLGNPLYLRILGKSILMAIAVTILCLVLSYLFAYLLTKLPRQVQQVMLVLVILPFWSSYLLRVYAW